MTTIDNCLKAISITIRPTELSFSEMEANDVQREISKYLDDAFKYWIISKEKAKSQHYNHYQAYGLYPQINHSNITKTITKKLKPFLKNGEELQTGRKKKWLLCKSWNDEKKKPMHGIGYCLKEGGLTLHNISPPDIQLCSEYYEEHKKFKFQTSKELGYKCSCITERYLQIDNQYYHEDLVNFLFPDYETRITHQKLKKKKCLGCISDKEQTRGAYLLMLDYLLRTTQDKKYQNEIDRAKTCI